jgi:hypothetical protein
MESWGVLGTIDKRRADSKVLVSAVIVNTKHILPSEVCDPDGHSDSDSPLYISTSTSSGPSKDDSNTWEYSNSSNDRPGVGESWLIGRCSIKNGIPSDPDCSGEDDEWPTQLEVVGDYANKHGEDTSSDIWRR